VTQSLSDPIVRSSPADRLARPDRLYQSVVEYILDRIAADQLQPGHALPTERELVAALGVSRNVLREGFRVLEARGLIVTRQGAGRYVRRLPDGDAVEQTDIGRLEVASIADTLEARRLLEEEVVGLACQRRSTREAQQIARLAERLSVWNDNVNFHSAIARATGNFMLERLVRDLVAILNELHQRQHYVQSVSPELILSEHRDIAAAILARDADAARLLVRRHLLNTVQSVTGRSDAGGHSPWWTV
jgi:GntR family transcriptional regulator, transcriptional repressor for pyruvate dehydrogenase complex